LETGRVSGPEVTTMPLLHLAAALLAFVLSPAALGPDRPPRDTLLVSTSWLAQHLKDPNLVLLHVGEKPEYDAKHIPGARFVDFQDLHMGHGAANSLTLEMPAPERLHDLLADLGISNTSRIVVYYGSDWVSPSTRVVFTLDYAGLDDVSLLDGGMQSWIREGRDVSTDVPAPRKGTLAPLKTRPLVVDADFVRSHVSSPGFAVIDARASSFYDGVQEGGPRDHRLAGHIAGARTVPFTSVTTDDLKLKSPEELTAIFAKAGVNAGDTIVGYCHIGQQATAMLFAARTLGHPVLLYDGSFEDWARRGYPVNNPARKDK
jgi:thiosulfate/3-mercaptopyruvate sulfurtransferase